MSAIVTTPASLKARVASANLRERSRTALSPLNLHYGGLAVLVLVNLYLVIQMAFTWQKLSSQDANAIAQQQVTLKTAEIAARPLEGLDVKLTKASATADKFYASRLPLTYSEVATELGVLAKKEGIHLTRVQYAQAPVSGEGASGANAGHLTEVRMDASLTGDYRPLVLFLNGLERDKTFFYINGITLTGQQTGTVNLRIRITTYLRGLSAAEQKTDTPVPESSLDKDLDEQAAKAAQAQAAKSGGAQ